MEDVRRLILGAWERLWPVLYADPAELARRLERRRKTRLGRPPRAWCLAVRASDTRITGNGALTFDSEEKTRISRHEVALDAPLVRRLCAGVRIDPPGEALRDVARKLGVSTRGLTVARLRGVFDVHYKRGLGGWWGKPVPMLYTDRTLDPSAALFQRPDPVWGWAAEHLVAAVPKTFEQRIGRVPVMRPTRGRGVAGEPRVWPSRKLPRQPDQEEDVLAWYKYKDGVYVGYDWRNPLSKKHYERHERRRAMERASRARLRRERGSTGSMARGSLRFSGWEWVCPACGKHVMIVYLPMPRIDIDVVARLVPRLAAPLAERVSRAQRSASGAAKRVTGFACASCHRVRHVSAAEPSAWNHLVTYLSGGMLYGSDVDKPEWFTPRRKRAYRPQTTRPAPRREQVRQRLREGWTIRDIAKELGVAVCAVHNHVKVLRAQCETGADSPQRRRDAENKNGKLITAR